MEQYNMAANDDLIMTVQSLIEICRDGNRGFNDAGDDVKESKLRDLLHNYSEQRLNFSAELDKLVVSLGGDINVTGTILGSVHRRWMDIKFGVIGSSTQGIIKECLRGEQAASKKYKEALSRELPDDVRKVLESQHDEIRMAIINLVRLSDVYSLSVVLD